MSVSVVIPSYNSELFLDEAVKSVLAQSRKVDNIIIVDDYSTDKSYEIALKLSKEHSLIKLYRNENNLGYAKNWNKCLKIASTDFVLLLHSDDVLKPKTIQKQLDFFELYPELAIVGGGESYIEKGSEIKQSPKGIKDKIYNQGEIYEFIKETGSYIPCSTVMFDLWKIKKIGFFQEGVLASDELYWPKVLNYYPIAILRDSLIKRRIHEGQTEYADFKNKKKEVIDWSNHFLKIYEYEKRSDKKKDLLVLMKKKTSNSCIYISGKAIVHHHSLRLWIFYVYFSIKFYPKIIVSLHFWKKIIKSLLLYIRFPYFPNI